MKSAKAIRILLTVILAGLYPLPVTQVYSHSSFQQAGADQPPIVPNGKPPEYFFVPCDTSDVSVVCSFYHLQLINDEYLQWKQTWTAHFAGGEFFQTEAVSDSVRLASNGPGQYFTAGSYTSVIFDAGKPVDWTYSQWHYSGTFSGLSVEFRTGSTPDPDYAWTGWASPQSSYMYTCAIMSTGQTNCFNSMGGIESNRYIQYRVLFNSSDPTTTIELNDINLVYGTHPVSGAGHSVVVAPDDLLAWEKVNFSATIPAGTSLGVDVLSADGTVLLENVTDGGSLADIDPHQYPAIKLRATLSTTDPSRTPELNRWRLQWSVQQRIYLPGIMR